MAKTRPRKRRLVKKYAANSPPKVEKKPTKKKVRKKKAKLPKPGSPFSDSESDPQTQIQTLLEPFSKDQLVTLVTDLSLSSASLFSLIKSAADEDVSHRKIFIHGLGWDATRDLVMSVFGPYGDIEELNVVNDRATGKCKGYAFITFRTRKSARKLLKNPKVQVGNRVTSCQLAAEGPAAPGVVSQQHFPSSDYPQRKIYVNNVPPNTNADRLRAFFEQFGEIENGPKGFDPTTGRFKGYAIFVYKTVEGAKKVLEDPLKVFDGCQLECRKAAEGKGKVAGGAASITTALQPVQPQMLAAVAAAQQSQAQTMPFLGQQMGLVNPYGGGMISSPNMGGLMGGYYGIMGGQVQGLGLGSYGVPGSYGVSAGAEGGSSGTLLQNMQYLYPSGMGGQTSSYLAKTPKTNEGYSPIWYDCCSCLYLTKKMFACLCDCRLHVVLTNMCSFCVKYVCCLHLLFDCLSTKLVTLFGRGFYGFIASLFFVCCNEACMMETYPTKTCIYDNKVNVLKRIYEVIWMNRKSILQNVSS